MWTTLDNHFRRPSGEIFLSIFDFQPELGPSDTLYLLEDYLIKTDSILREKPPFLQKKSAGLNIDSLTPSMFISGSVKLLPKLCLKLDVTSRYCKVRSFLHNLPIYHHFVEKVTYGSTYRFRTCWRLMTAYGMHLVAFRPTRQRSRIATVLFSTSFRTSLLGRVSRIQSFKRL